MANVVNFNINDFRAQLRNGGVRPNQFAIQIAFPSTIPNIATNELYRTSSFLVNIAELPGVSIGTVPIYYRGRELKLPGDKSFAPFTCTILNDTDFSLRKGLEGWMNVMESNIDKKGYTAPGLYFGQIIVSQLDRSGNTLRYYVMKNAYPNDIGAVGLDFSANDQLSSFQVAFQYQHYEVSKDFGDVNESQAVTGIN
jgi:hypothetical protein